MVWRLYQRILGPKAEDEDTRRKELILNILLVGVITLVVVLLLIVTIKQLALGATYSGMSPLLVALILAIFTTLFIISRRGWWTAVAYMFIGIFFALATWMVMRWGVTLPQAILAYSLILVMTGVLVSSRAAFYMAALIFLTLLVVMHLAEVHTLTFNVEWRKQPGGYSDVIGYGITFLVIGLVVWLSNREIDRSLARARQSESELLEERNSLERKVRERTKELERSHVEKMIDLQRFAEFGQLSSTLLHEIANPLMSVSLNLELLEEEKRPKMLARAREGIAHMEQYVEAARRQLRNQSEIKLFDVADETRRIAGFLRAKAEAEEVEVKLSLLKDVQLRGDSIRFNHIISNLMTNAIDAYEGLASEKKRTVEVKMERKGKDVEIAVRDHGRGITDKQLPHLFEPFYTTKESRGTGIGLVITKQAVEEVFQGKISVSSNKQSGTRFVVRLPLA